MGSSYAMGSSYGYRTIGPASELTIHVNQPKFRKRKAPRSRGARRRGLVVGRHRSEATNQGREDDVP